MRVIVILSVMGANSILYKGKESVSINETVDYMTKEELRTGLTNLIESVKIKSKNLKDQNRIESGFAGIAPRACREFEKVSIFTRDNLYLYNVKSV